MDVMVIGGLARATLDLADMPQGQRYEDRYQGYLDVFKKIATMPRNVEMVVKHAPWSWVPLLRYLRVVCDDSRDYFDHCPAVRGALSATVHATDRVIVLDRTMVEVLCSFRPECADALWKIDMQWKVEPGRVQTYPADREFIVTTNGAYHRPEILNYMEKLLAFKPTKRNVVLVPCAADKPYPAPMHREVMERMPHDYYIMNATGVVGLVPDALWKEMPHYDSGIPNEWRLFQTMRWFFNAHRHDRVIVYCDFYSTAIELAFRTLWPFYAGRVHFVLPPGRYDDYVNLMDPELLAKLSDAFSRPWEFSGPSNRPDDIRLEDLRLR